MKEEEEEIHKKSSCNHSEKNSKVKKNAKKCKTTHFSQKKISLCKKTSIMPQKTAKKIKKILSN